jgi:hypothetical protein
MNLIPFFIAVFVASGYATMVDVNFITGTAFLGDVKKQSENFLDNGNECIGVGVGANCRSNVKENEDFCVSIISWPWPVVRKEFYFRNQNESIERAKLSFWGTSFDPQYSNSQNDGIYLVNTATVLSDIGCTKF